MVFCPTPIGNLQDITLRVLQVLRQADYIICEDTRVTRKLLSHYNIRKRLISFHKNNVKRAIENILRILGEGKNCALVTDAGTPGIQDPGGELIPVLENQGVSYEVIPGPSSVLPAVVYSGYASEGFIFSGFFPRRKAERMRILKEFSAMSLPVVFFLSPNRLCDELDDIGKTFGYHREAILCRELTKIYEERIRGTLQELLEQLCERESVIRGEIVLVVQGVLREAIKEKNDVSPEILSLARDLLAKGFSRKVVAEIVSTHFPVRKNNIKRYLQTSDSVDFGKEN